MVTIMLVVVVAYAGWRFQLGATHLGPFPVPPVTPGTFTGFIAALLMGGQSLRQLANLQTVMSEGLIAGRRLFATLDVQPQITDAPAASALPIGQARVRLENVTFSYSGETAVLDELTLEARRGEIVALVGPSGAGKTTVLNLIPRFYDVTGGKVTIDDFDVRDVGLASLRRQIALVTQEPFLFDDTIRANIAYAKDDATDAEIEAAARHGGGARLHHCDAEGLRHTGGRSWHAALRRPAPARRHRAGVLEGRADPLARRGDQRPRHRERGAGAGGAGAADGRAHHHHHRPPALHRARRGPYLRALRRPGGGGRRPWPADRPRRPLRAPRRGAEPRCGAGGSQ